MGRPFSTPEHRAEIRRTIRAAAAELYRREGLSGISVRRVAQQAGVSVGAIYAHFEDLTGLMQSLWTGQVERQNIRFAELIAGVEDPVERLRVLIDAYLHFGIDHAELYRNAFLFVRPESHPKPIPAKLETHVFPRLLMEALQEGQRQGRVRDGDVSVLAQVLWSGVHGCLALPSNLDRVDFCGPADIAGPMIQALVRGVLVCP